MITVRLMPHAKDATAAKESCTPASAKGVNVNIP